MKLMQIFEDATGRYAVRKDRAAGFLAATKQFLANL